MSDGFVIDILREMHIYGEFHDIHVILSFIFIAFVYYCGVRIESWYKK